MSSAAAPGDVLDPTSVTTAGTQIEGRTPWQLFWRRFRQDKFAIAGCVFIVLMTLLAISAPWIADNLLHRGPNNLFIYDSLDEYGLPIGPTFEKMELEGELQHGFWFGADQAGRDLFIRVIYGARTSLFVALVATGIATIIGVTIGMIAGFYRGKIDTFLMRLTDVVLSLPILLLALGLSAACGLQKEGCLGGLIRPGLLLVSYIIGLFSWPYIARIIRGQVFSLREKEFVEAARAQGASNLRIMTREILPNVIAPIIVYTTLIIPINVIFEAALSFLGVGVPATTPSWGRMLSEASAIFEAAWWMMFFPGFFLFMTTLAFNLAGDGLRDALDPKTAK
ncbi:MAG: ABC transporter permease [Actinobacteria bacterium]|nr:ABC transporter permease [Actinomycetota bacterium]